MIQPDRAQMAVCCMHFPSWVRKAYRHTLRICNAYCFFITSMVARTRRNVTSYRGASKSFARPTSRCIFSNSENISFDASLVLYIQ
jgi:hypothetical protein